MGLGTGLLKIIVFVSNFIFFILGGCMLALGVLLLVLNFDGGIKDFINNINDSVLDVAIWTMVCLGAFIFLAGFMGCCGTCKGSECMLCTFSIFMSVLVLLEVLVIIYGSILLGNVGGDLEERMVDQVKNNYTFEAPEDDPYVTAWDKLQEEKECCGSIDYRDYRNSSYATESGNPVPPSCCSSRTSDCHTEARSNVDPDCKDGEPRQGSWSELSPCGCFSPLSESLSSVGAAFVSITAIAAVCQAVLIVFACCLKSSISKKKVSPAGESIKM